MNGTRAAEAGVVHEDLDVELERLHLREHLVAALIRAEVGGDVLGADAVRLIDLVGESLEAILATGDERQAIATLRELARDLLADPGRGAGDEDGGRISRLRKCHGAAGYLKGVRHPLGNALYPRYRCLIPSTHSAIPEELQRRLAEFAEQMQGAQQVSFADNAINLAVQMTVASIQRLNLQGTSDEQAMQVRDAIRVVFPEAVTLVREAREGLS